MSNLDQKLQWLADDGYIMTEAIPRIKQIIEDELRGVSPPSEVPTDGDVPNPSETAKP